MSPRRDLEREAERARYVLRSSFFYEEHKNWERLCHLVEVLCRSRVNWAKRGRWGISEAAWSRIGEKGVSPPLVFCHPKTIAKEPLVIAYYRCLALLPQKGVQRLSIATASLEEGKTKSIGMARAEKLAATLNGLVCLLVESDPAWTLEGARIAALLNLGTQTNGSWRNAIGTEGSRRIKELLVGTFMVERLVKAIDLKDGTTLPIDQPLPPLEEVRGFKTITGFLVTFGSEPDVSVRDFKGILIATVEIKYGLDLAGALERYGAAKKSFEEATRENRRVINIYLPAVITQELRRRIDDDRLVNQDFNITEILSRAAIRQKFLEFFKKLVEL